MIYYKTIKSDRGNPFADGEVLTVAGDEYTMNNVSSDSTIYKVQVDCLTNPESKVKPKLQATDGVTILTEEEYNALI